MNTVNPIHFRIEKMVRSHVSVACSKNSSLRERVRSGRYSFTDLDHGKPEFVGHIFCGDYTIPTEGSIRYGDCLALPDDRGFVFLVYLGVRSENNDHTIVGMVVPEEATEDRIHSELQRMWSFRRDQANDVMDYVPASLIHNNGPALDMAYDDVQECVGRINHWFEAQMYVTDRVRVGDYMETRLKTGANRESRARIEATENGFILFVGDKTERVEEEVRVLEWRMLWQSPSLEECVHFAVASNSERTQWVDDLVNKALESGGSLRYINGGMFGLMRNDESVFAVKNWMVYQLDQRSKDIVFNFSLDVRDVVSLCA